MARKRKQRQLQKLQPGAAVILYARASSEDDRQEGSVEDQMAANQEWAERKGYRVVGKFFDRMSGGTPVESRPGFREALRSIRDSQGDIQALVCKRIDRAFRDVHVGLTAQTILEEAGCWFIGTDDPEIADNSHRAAFNLVRTNLMAAAQMQREITGEMVRDKQFLKVKNGIHHSGKAPFGYVSAPGQHQLGTVTYAGWVPDESEYGGKTIADWVRWMFAEAIHPSGVIKDAEGRPSRTLNLMGMADYLTEKGVPTPSKLAWRQRPEEKRAASMRTQERNKQLWAQSPDLKKRFKPLFTEDWDSSQVSDMLRRKAYIGQVLWNGEYFPGKHQPLIDEATFAAVQLALSKNDAFTQRHPSKQGDLLLAQMVACGGCDHAMHKHEATDKKVSYRCTKAKKTRGKGCDNPLYRDFRLHQAAHQALLAGLYEKWERVSVIIPDPPSVVENRDAERDALLRERDIVLFQHQKGWITDEMAEEKMAPLMRDLAAIDKARKAPAERARTKAEIEGILVKLEEGWNELPLPLRQQVLRAYVPGGFTVYRHILKATVAGIEVEVAVEQGEASKPNVIPGWLGTTEAARRLGKHENTLNYWCRNGKIPAVRLDNGHFRIPEQALEKVGGGYVLAPDAWGRCRQVIEDFQTNQNGLQLEALQTVSVVTSDACGIECVGRSGGISSHADTPTIRTTVFWGYDALAVCLCALSLSCTVLHPLGRGWKNWYIHLNGKAADRRLQDTFG